jgi:CubicO group peptidase (beta-lactamase class C family)
MTSGSADRRAPTQATNRPGTRWFEGRRRGWRTARIAGAVLATIAIAVGVAAPSATAARAGPRLASTSTALDLATVAPDLDPGAAAVIARHQASIPDTMTKQGIPGLAVAVVDGDRPIWIQGFGTTKRGGGTPVTADTTFSVQSMSKTFTATAVMQAVERGLIDLDAPITTYLPDFTVHSAFEDHPERKITLRMLLGCTAGFTHEAPVGNNFDRDPGAWEDHVRSISDTWLRFPVGSGFAYSNLGFDLAAHILERVEGKPFAQVMRDQLLAPLGMDRSTFDRAEIRSADNRAVGTLDLDDDPPPESPMTGAGGLWTSANDLARFLSFQVGDGVIDGESILDPALMTEMRTIPEPYPGAASGYALGVSRTRWRAGGYQDIFVHGGGGIGFIADLWWVPSLDLGVALLTNSTTQDLQGWFALSVLGDLVRESSVYRDRLAALPTQGEFFELSGDWLPPTDLADEIAAAALPASDDQAARWASYAGPYRLPDWGVIIPGRPADRYEVRDGIPYWASSEDGPRTEHRLTEVQPGIFLADDGETLDLSSSPPTWRNLDLVRVEEVPLPWQWALLVLAALAAVAWLVGGLVGVIRRRRGRAPIGAEPPPPGGAGWRKVMAGVATVGSVLVLTVVAALIAIPGVIDAGFLGRLELPAVVRVAYHLPLAIAVVAVALVALAAVAWARGWWRPGSAPRYVALTVGVVVFAAQLVAWRLVGWGLA